MKVSTPSDAHRVFAEKFNAGDLAALVALYEPGAQIVTQDGQSHEGHPAIQAVLDAFLSSGGKIQLDPRYVYESGDVALLRGQWVLAGTGPDGTPFRMGGNTAEVMRRQEDGSWLYVIDHPFGAD